MFQGTEGTLVANYDTLQDHSREGPDHRRAAQDAAALGGPSPRVAQRHQDPRPMLVPLRLRPPAGSVGHLGNIALWTGEKLKWDAAAERIMNHPEANRWLTKEYRRPWDAARPSENVAWVRPTYRLMLIRFMVGFTHPTGDAS